MHLEKCKHGHIYDTEKFRTCPHCYGKVGDMDQSELLGMNQLDRDTGVPDEVVSKQFDILHMRRVVGMLICTSGGMMGQGFLLKEGENVIGRGANMDVPVVLDETVSRKNHAVIQYHMQEDRFILECEAGRDDIRLNEKPVKPGSRMKNGDRLQLGSCELILVEAGNVWRASR